VAGAAPARTAFVSAGKKSSSRNTYLLRAGARRNFPPYHAPDR
jgi:hypothetical protein